MRRSGISLRMPAINDGDFKDGAAELLRYRNGL